jgi:hypothetical protein
LHHRLDEIYPDQATDGRNWYRVSFSLVPAPLKKVAKAIRPIKTASPDMAKKVQKASTVGKLGKPAQRRLAQGKII